MSPILRKQLKNKIDNLASIYQGLKRLQRLTLQDLEDNIENIWSVTFGIVAAVEAIMDIGQYILSEKGLKVESYGQIPEKLLQAKIINRDFSTKLTQMIGFRNRAIHNYPSLDEKQLYNILQEGINDFKQFLKLAKKYIG